MAPDNHPFAVHLPAIELELVATLAPGEWQWDHTQRRFLAWGTNGVTSWPDSRDDAVAAVPADFPEGRLRAASVDCRAVAALSYDRLVIGLDGLATFASPVDPGWLDHHVIGAVGFPWNDNRAVAVRPTVDPTRYLVSIIGAAGEQVGEFELSSDHPSGFMISGHPLGQGFTVDAGRGQDGADMWSFRHDGSEWVVSRSATEDRIFAGFSPDGTEMVTTPHWRSDLVIHSWPSWTEVATLPAKGVFSAEGDHLTDYFDYFAVFLTGDTIVAMSTEHGALVVINRHSGQPVYRLELPGRESNDEGERSIESFALMNSGHLTTGGSGTDIWAVPRVVTGV